MSEPKKTTSDAYRIRLPDEEWQLEDLYELPHAFEQCYAFVYCLDTELLARDRESIDRAFAAYPWRGGYSYVNIYFVLKNQLPYAARPRLKSMHKASPGWIDLYLSVDAAIQVAKAVGILSTTAVAAAKAYSQVRKTLSRVTVERERAKLDAMKLTQSQTRTMISLCEDMAKFLGFKNVKELHERTGNPEVSLKLLAAHYRRTSVLVEFVKDGKAEFPEESDG